MPRLSLVIAFALVLLVVAMIVGTAIGDVTLPLGKTVGVLWDALLQRPPTGWEHVVVLSVRLPRVLLGALLGGGLAIAGGVMQALFRNPLADPAIVGVSGGSALGAVLALYLTASQPAAWSLPVAAFAGGVGCALLVYRLSTLHGRTPMTTLLLAGLAVGTTANAATSFVLSLSLAEWEVGRQMLVWLMGGLEGRSWAHLAMAAPLVLGGTAWVLLHARELNVLSTGEESALSVGIDVPRRKRDMIVLSSLITAGTVAVMGIVPFVGLMVPHMVRLVVGPDQRRLLPASFLVGAAFLVLADTVCRALWFTDLRLGVVTALTGGPFFLFLLLRHQRKALAT
jgi:iron complex transport system permease protein